MSPDSFITLAIEAGARDGVASLDADQRLVFLVSEAEILCDMEGIDSFIDRNGPEWLAECAIAFETTGASEIALGLRQIGPDTATDDPILERLNTMITGRVGSNDEAIRRAVELRLKSDPARHDSGPTRQESGDPMLDL
jgi:hypothetical protein